MYIKEKGEINKIVVACDVGIGSSAIGASILKRKIKNAGLNLEVKNASIDKIPQDTDLIITNKELINEVRKRYSITECIGVDEFISTSVYDELVNLLIDRNNNKINDKLYEYKKEVIRENVSNVLLKENIKLGLESVSKEEAIETAGKILVDSGYVNYLYIDAMIRRENKLTTYIGKGVAIPHGAKDVETSIFNTGICILQYPNGIKFGDEIAYLIIGIASLGNEHLMILSKLAEILEDKIIVEQLQTTKDVEFVYKHFL